MFTLGAIYRFTRTDQLRYYRAARTQSDMDFLYPISVNGSRIADQKGKGRRYVILYFMTKWDKLAASGYWLDPKEAFEKAYVTDATEEDLELVAYSLDDLAEVDVRLDDVLNRHEIEVDMEVWGSILEDGA